MLGGPVKVDLNDVNAHRRASRATTNVTLGAYVCPLPPYPFLDSSLPSLADPIAGVASVSRALDILFLLHLRAPPRTTSDQRALLAPSSLPSILRAPRPFIPPFGRTWSSPFTRRIRAPLYNRRRPGTGRVMRSCLHTEVGVPIDGILVNPCEWQDCPYGVNVERELVAQRGLPCLGVCRRVRGRYRGERRGKGWSRKMVDV